MASDAEHFLHVLVGHVYVFFGENSVNVFYPFHDWAFCFLCVEFDKILNISSLSDTSFANIFSHSVGCLLVSLTVSSAVQKLFILSPNSSFLLLFLLPLWMNLARIY